MQTSLSKYFPPDTEYFYSFPEGQESNFFSDDPPWKEELFATRPLVCAGDTVKVIVFASSMEDKTWRLLYNDIGTPRVRKHNILTLPPEINTEVKGEERSHLIKQALKKIVTPGKLVMAQPFLDEELRDCYQIPPELSVWLNDKKNMPEYIDTQYMPERYRLFANGASFAASAESFPLPCVVKVSSSASGDGVRICRDATSFENAKKEFTYVLGTIIIEKFVDFFHNVGIQFAIPADAGQRIEIIGVNEQLTTANGEYLGAIIDRSKRFPTLREVYKMMSEQILPQVRAKGWYGIGGLDVLLGKDGRFHFIDCNFRMTAMTAYLYQVKNGLITRSLATFTGTFTGNEEDFKRVVLPLAKRRNNPRQIMEIITLTNRGSTYHFNAGVFFDSQVGIANSALYLLSLGIESEALRRFSTSPNSFISDEMSSL